MGFPLWNYYMINPRRMRERGLQCVSVCVSVCLCVCPGKISFYVRSHQPVMVPTVCIRQILGLKRVDFTKNARVESYGDKYLSRRS